VDALSQRYGWEYNSILGDMYWEEVYEMYEYASNLQAIEKNEDMKFNFMLHAGSKEAIDNWKDLPIPYPDRNWIAAYKAPSENVLPQSLRNKFYHSTPASEEQKRRAKEVQLRVEETQRKARDERAKRKMRQYIH